MDNSHNTDQTSPRGVNALPKWALYTIAAVAVLLILIMAYGFGNGRYYQVYPPGQAVSPASSTPPSVIDPERAKHYLPFDQALAAAKVGHTQYYCEGINAEFPTIASDAPMSRSALEATQKQFCESFDKKGTGAIQNALAVESAYVSPESGGYGGVGFVHANGSVVMVNFSLQLSRDNVYEFSIPNRGPIILQDLATLSSASITARDAGDILTLYGTDAAGIPITQYRGEYTCSYCSSDFEFLLVRNTDSTFSSVAEGAMGLLYSNPPKPNNVRFLMPYNSYLDKTVPARDFQMEQQSVSPLYHLASCGLEETYSDIAFTGDVAIDINLGFESRLHVTTSKAGYVPEQWGTVLKDIDMSDFVKAVQTPKAFNSNAKVEMLNIGGYTVKHIGPITLSRTCQYDSDFTRKADMYQAIKGGAVVTFTISQERGVVYYADIKKVISQVLSTMTLTRP